MKIDSRYFRSRRYRVLYFLMPLMNGVAFVVVANAIFTAFGGGIPDGDFTGDFWTDVQATTVAFMRLLALGMFEAVIIAVADLAVLGRIYRRNLIVALIDSWREPIQGAKPERPFIGPLALAALGHMAALIFFAFLSPWQLSPGMADVGACILFVALTYVHWVLPILVLAEEEESQAGLENARSANIANRTGKAGS